MRSFGKTVLVAGGEVVARGVLVGASVSPPPPPAACTDVGASSAEPPPPQPKSESVKGSSQVRRAHLPTPAELMFVRIQTSNQSMNQKGPSLSASAAAKS